MSSRGLGRFWIYQKERFPVFAHGPLIAAFALSAVSFSMLLRGIEKPPALSVSIVAFVTVFLFFLQLRIADEFKDFDEDSRFRPYRAVPRGLVTLRELRRVFIFTALMQWVLALLLQPALLFLLVVVWIYLTCMSNEFFMREWLKARPFTYMWTHMLIMPLIDLYATACDWLGNASAMPDGLFWFLCVSFFNGMVIEIGRKIRAPQQEEVGVETYTAVWGPAKATVAWLMAMSCTAVCAIMAALKIQFFWPVFVLLLLLMLLALWVVRRFRLRALPNTARWFEPISGIWTLCLYLSIGLVPLLLRIGT